MEYLEGLRAGYLLAGLPDNAEYRDLILKVQFRQGLLGDANT
jgi:hypothetical protein